MTTPTDSSRPVRALPLSGVRVLDLSRVLAGPLAAQMLADLGAEVIKIERPGAGDDSRAYGPPFIGGDAGQAAGESGFFHSCNRGKQSVTVDLAHPEGQAIVRELAAKADVLVENFRVDTLAKYGLDYASLKKVNPKLVYCSITGYGQTGPKRFAPGYDAIFQAQCGLMSMTGIPDGQPGGGPMKAGPSLVDILTSQYASTAIIAALYHRDLHDGQGQHIDMALMDCGVAAMTHYTQQYLVSGIKPPRRGTAGNGGVPSQMFKGSDGKYVMLTVGNNTQWGRFCKVLQRPDLITDPRFDTGPRRIVNRDALIPILSDVFIARPATDWLAELDAADIPCGPINDLDDVFADEQVKHRGLKVSVPHPMVGQVELLTNPIRLSDTPIDSAVPNPALGQHTRQVLGEVLKLDAAAIERLAANGVI
jgi:crotonobetainyl-CoA:carnitine CoA-transferase CaiB-like acyl-CoA transferase